MGRSKKLKIKEQFGSMAVRLSKVKNIRAYSITVIAVLGVITLLISNAATFSISIKPKLGGDCVKSISDGTASEGSAIQFCTATISNNPGSPGAKLPINYDISSIPSSAKYVSVDGNDSSAGTANAPVKTLSKAISLASNGGVIVVKNGTYREGGLSISSNKSLKVIAYPGHTPVFSGSVPVNGGWQAEGSYSYIGYTPRPVTSGSRISFADNQNLAGDFVGKYPDQVWIGNTQLKQVVSKGSLKDGVFWVDQSNKRLYLSAADSKKSNIEVSGSKGRFISIESPNSSFEGITITRYSNGGADYGVITFQSMSNNSGLRNVKVSDSAYMAIMFAGDSNANNRILKDNFIESVTIENSGWMGISSHYTDNFIVNNSKVQNMNLFDEFTSSPQSGGIKLNRTRYSKITNSDFSYNKSYGIWYDMSNKSATIANNVMIDNKASALFYEISDDLLLVNNYIKAQSGSQAFKAAGSSGLKIVNNTIIGGKDPIGIYTDSRSRPGCADPSKPLCSGLWAAVRDNIRPYDPLIDFYPRIDLMINNIIAYPNTTGYCGKITVVCITSTNGSAVAPIETIIHKANTSRGIPETKINGNVYVNDNGALVVTAKGTYSKITDFTNAMAGAPVSISGIDAISKSGSQWVTSDGTPTSALSAVHNQAQAIPNNAALNKWINEGTKHYGVLYK